MTLEHSNNSSTSEMDLEDFSSSSKTVKKSYVMTKHVSRKVSTSSSVCTSGSSDQELSSLFNNDSNKSLMSSFNDNTSRALANIDMSNLGIDMGSLGIDMGMGLDLNKQLASMDKEMNSSSQKLVASSKKTKTTTSSSTSSSSRQLVDSAASSSSSLDQSQLQQQSAICNNASSASGPFKMTIPLGNDVKPEEIEVALEELSNGMQVMTVRAAQETQSETKNSKSMSSRKIIKKFTIPSNVDVNGITSTFTYEGENSILRIEAPVMQTVPQITHPQEDVPISIKFEEF